jgi:Uma2 family endonuclease
MSTVNVPDARDVDSPPMLPGRLGVRPCCTSLFVADPVVAEKIRSEREGSEAGERDEVWNGVYVVSPIANNEHQFLAFELSYAFRAVIGLVGGGRVFNGVNVSDRVEGWKENFRIPDAAVVLNGGRASDCGTHLHGGPDLVVEVVSPNDLARDKRPFYARIGVRELLIVDRDPWALDLYRLEGGELELAGRSTPDEPEPLASIVLPLELRLVPGQDRPQIEVRRTDGSQTWTI